MKDQRNFYLLPRDRTEIHRGATPLELMFDLASVIAIAVAASGLHHAVSEAHFTHGVLGFLFAFFMIWLAWMNYTWFASAYDNGSLWFQMISMVIMFGALVLAAGIPAVFAVKPLYLGLIGFIIMRLGLVALWLAAARGDPNHRSAAQRYAIGISAIQIYWIAIILLLPATSDTLKWAFLLGFAGELAIPVFAERNRKTAWHRHHIIERYGLLNIIVLGECFLAIVLALRAEGSGGIPPWHLLEIGLLASVITFALWALYFSDDAHLSREELTHVLIWGYGHFALFGAGAATGAGFAVMLEYAEHHTQISETAAALSVAIPVAIYVFTLWLVRDRYCVRGATRFLMPASALLVLAAGAYASAQALPIIAAILVITLLLRRIAGRTQ